MTKQQQLASVTKHCNRIKWISVPLSFVTSSIFVELFKRNHVLTKTTRLEITTLHSIYIEILKNLVNSYGAEVLQMFTHTHTHKHVQNKKSMGRMKREKTVKIKA